MRLKQIGKDSVLNFPLAPLVDFDPNVIFKNPQLVRADAFIVALALAFNDCKDLLHHWEVLNEFQPEKPRKGVTAQYGQYCGMMGHCFRKQVALLHEVLELLTKHNDVLMLPIFSEVVSGLNSQAKKGWSSLLDLAGLSDGVPVKLKSLKALIKLIREKGSYHYDTDVLKAGFESHFSKGGPENERAYVSYGKNLEESRFYFADATITSYHGKKMKRVDPNFQKTIAKYLRGLHPAFREVIGRYLRVRRRFSNSC